MRTAIYSLALFVAFTSFVVAQDQTQAPEKPATDQKSNPQFQAAKQETPELPPEISDDFKKDIRKLLDLNKDLNNRYASIFNLFANYKLRVPGVPLGFWQQCDQLLSKDDLADYIIPEYAKQYTHQDVKDLIAFFESRVGKKFVRATKQISIHANIAAGGYGRAFFEKIYKKLDDAGYRR